MFVRGFTGSVFLLYLGCGNIASGWEYSFHHYVLIQISLIHRLEMYINKEITHSVVENSTILLII